MTIAFASDASGKRYVVTLQEGTAACDCPDFVYRKLRATRGRVTLATPPCKHITALRERGFVRVTA